MKSIWILIITFIVLFVGYLPSITLLSLATGESSFDRWIEGHEKIFRVETQISPPGAPTILTAAAPEPIINELSSNSVDLVDVVTSFRQHNATVQLSLNSQIKLEAQTLQVDEFFGEIFRQGAKDIDSGLKANEVIISQKLANDLFGSSDSVGRQIIINGNAEPKIVKSVVAPFPSATHFHFDLLEPLPNNFTPQKSDNLGKWFQLGTYTYIKLKQRSENNIKAIVKRLDNSVNEQLGKYGNDPKRKSPAEIIDLNISEISGIHFRDNIEGSLKAPKNKALIYILMVMSVVIFIIVSISAFGILNTHFLNQNTQFAIKKLEGASTFQICVPTLMKTIILVVCAFLLSLLTYQFLSNYIQSFLTNDFVVASFSNPHFYVPVVFMFFLSLLISLLGIFIHVHQIDILSSLKGYSPYVKSKSVFATIMIVAMVFFVTIAAIGTVGVNQQFKKLLNHSNNIETRGVYAIAEANNRGAIKQEQIKKVAEIYKSLGMVDIAVTSNYTPGMGAPPQTNIENFDSSMSGTVSIIRGSHDLAPLMGIQFLHGKPFNKDQISEKYNSQASGAASGSIILSKSVTQDLGFTIDFSTIGQFIKISLDDQVRNFRIQAIIDDTNMIRPNAESKPVAIIWDENISDHLLVKVRGDADNNDISPLSDVYNNQINHSLKNIISVDSIWKGHLKSELMTSKILLYSSLLFLLISLVSLSSYVTQKLVHSKRETIIKTLEGCSASRILYEISNKMMIFIGVSILLAVLVSIKMFRKWSSDFPLPYQLSITDVIFPIIIIIATIILILTVQTYNVSKNLNITGLKET